MTRLVIEVLAEWDIVAARQFGRNEAKELGFNEVDQAGITTVISELARNIYLYARAGEIVIERMVEQNRVGIRVIATELGQGISDIGKIVEDNFLESDGLVESLPGMERLMDKLVIESEVGRGAFIKAEKWVR